MTFKIRPKRSGTAGKIPTAAQLDTGEIAINLVDKKLFFKDAAGIVQELDGSYAAQQPTNLGLNKSNSSITITSSTGADVTIPAAGTVAGVMTKAQVTALTKAGADGAAALAKANVNTQELVKVNNRLDTADAGVEDAIYELEKALTAVARMEDEIKNLHLRIDGIPTVPPNTAVQSVFDVIIAQASGTTTQRVTINHNSTDKTAISRFTVNTTEAKGVFKSIQLVPVSGPFKNPTGTAWVQTRTYGTKPPNTGGTYVTVSNNPLEAAWAGMKANLPSVPLRSAGLLTNPTIDYPLVATAFYITVKA